MEPQHLYTFQVQAFSQCLFFVEATRDYDAALAAANTTRIWAAIQSMLNAAANISKACWGPGGKLAQERKPLRDSIGIDDSSPLREVLIRNDFEHIDERIDRWWRESKRHNYVDLNLGRVADFAQNINPPPEDIDVFRNLDPLTGDLRFWGSIFNLKTLSDEVHRIQPVLRELVEKNPSLVPPASQV